jgi:hypothetical protein
MIYDMCDNSNIHSAGCRELCCGSEALERTDDDRGTLLYRHR